MGKRIALAFVVVAGLVGCGGTEHDTAKEATFQNPVITRNADSTFTLKSGNQTLNNISTFKLRDAKQEPTDVQSFMVSDEVTQQQLCCASCSYSGGTLICTGCTSC
jgi:hypothetical protein